MKSQGRMGRKFLQIAGAAAVLLIAFVAGGGAEHHLTREQPYRSWMIKLGLANAERVGTRISRLEDAEAADCGAPENVVLVLGQSNVANFVDDTSGTFPDNVLNFYDGNCYIAADPLLGATGSNGSLWSRIDWPRQTVLVPMAIGGTQIKEWSPGGPLWTGVSAGLYRLEALGLTPTHIFFHQGEEDSMEATDPAIYEENMVRLLSAIKDRIDARIVVGLVSFCRNVSSPEILEAQRRAIARAGVEEGPNTDLLGPDYRYDDCHLNDRGAIAAAAQWQQFLD